MWEKPVNGRWVLKIPWEFQSIENISHCVLKLNSLSPHNPGTCSDFCQFPWYQLIIEILGQVGGTWGIAGVGEEESAEILYLSHTQKEGRKPITRFY